jgi:hypothetical protein
MYPSFLMARGLNILPYTYAKKEGVFMKARYD